MAHVQASQKSTHKRAKRPCSSEPPPPIHIHSYIIYYEIYYILLLSLLSGGGFRFAKNAEAINGGWLVGGKHRETRL